MTGPRGAGRRGSTSPRGAIAVRRRTVRCARVGFGLAFALLACARCVAAVADPAQRDRCDAPIDGTDDRPVMSCDATDAGATDAGDRRLTGVSTTAEFFAIATSSASTITAPSRRITTRSSPRSARR